MIRKARAKARWVKKPESVTSATNLDICVKTVRCTRNVWSRKVETKRQLTRQLQFKERQRQCKEQWSKRGSTLNMTVFWRLLVLFRDQRRTFALTVVHLDQRVRLCARCVSERHSTAIVFD